MATYYLSSNRGKKQTPQDITAGTSVPSADFYFFTSTANNPTKNDQILFLDAVRDYILTNGVGTTAGPGVDLPPN